MRITDSFSVLTISYRSEPQVEAQVKMVDPVLICPLPFRQPTSFPDMVDKLEMTSFIESLITRLFPSTGDPDTEPLRNGKLINGEQSLR